MFFFFLLSWKQGSHLRKVSRGAKKDGGDVSKGRGAAFKDVLDDDGEDEVTIHRCTRAHTHKHNIQRASEGFSFVPIAILPVESSLTFAVRCSLLLCVRLLLDQEENEDDEEEEEDPLKAAAAVAKGAKGGAAAKKGAAAAASSAKKPAAPKKPRAPAKPKAAKPAAAKKRAAPSSDDDDDF